MGPLGWPETVFIFFLALILFGPKKLPELGKTVGKALTEFRRASNELKSTFDREMQNLEQETASINRDITNQIQSDSYNYDYSSYDSTYQGSYGTEPYDNPVSNPDTVSASATQDAHQPAALPEGTIAYGADIGETAYPESVAQAADPSAAYVEQLQDRPGASPAESHS
jgi:TatA/E family protein of Tat protein translocase